MERLLAPQAALPHCNTLDRPVMADARLALAKEDITPVLKWLQAKDEKEVRETSPGPWWGPPT